jgi:hypothetical protein
MLTACCQHKHKRGRPYLHNKGVIVRNLRLLFAQIPKVIINDYGSVKDWFKEASQEAYWTALVQCLLNKQAPLPTRPTMWPPPRQHSSQGHTSSSVPPSDTDDPTADDDHSRSDSTDPPPIPSLPCRCRLPPPPSPNHQQSRTDYDPEMVGQSLEHSFEALGLSQGATETKFKVKYLLLLKFTTPTNTIPPEQE